MMTDFDYDCYLKKNIAHSASKRKIGSKSKKCSLTTDYMTEKQWNERCGEVMSYQIGKPMNWNEFCKLPSDLKEEYMNNLIEQYSANARNMADMFGVSVATVFRIVKKENLKVTFLKGKHPSGQKEEQFKRFLAGEAEKPIVFAVEEEVAQKACNEKLLEPTPETISEREPLQNSDEKPERKKARLDSFFMEFSGPVDVDMIANSLRYILVGCDDAKISISCTLI